MVFGSRNSEDNEDSEAAVPSEEQTSDSEDLDESETPDDGNDSDRRQNIRSSRLRSRRHRFSRRESNMRMTRSSVRLRNLEARGGGGERRLLTRRSRIEYEEHDDFEDHFIDEIEPQASRRIRNLNFDGTQNVP